MADQLGEANLKLGELSDRIKDTNVSSKEILDDIENKYLPEVRHFDPKDFDVGMTLFYDLPKRIITGDDFIPNIVDLKNADDERIKDFPETIKLHLKLDDEGKAGHAQFRKFPDDPLWSKYWKIVDKYSKRIFEIVENNPSLVNSYSGQDDKEKIQNFKVIWNNYRAHNYATMLSEVKEKSIGSELISSGQWLGSGTSSKSIERIIETDGKLKSTYHVLNSGGSYNDMVGVNGGDLHKAFIFFFHWKNTDEQYNKGLDTVGRYGTLGEGGKLIMSDVGVFYPVDTVIKHGLSIGSYLGDKSTNEFFITKSPDVVSNNTRLDKDKLKKLASEDETEIPISEAYLRVDSQTMFDNLKKKFNDNGYSDDWVVNHIFIQNPGAPQEDFRLWLKSRDYVKADIEPYRSTQYGNNYLWNPSNKT